MVCQICGKRSGYYPICKEHYKMYVKGEVEKCSDCNMWYIIAEGCPRCSDSSKSAIGRGEIRFTRDILEKWGKKLYAIAMNGLKYGREEYDFQRYQTVQDVSADLQEVWKDMSNEVVSVPVEKIEAWSSELTQIANKGLEYSDDTYDIDRYSNILETAEEMYQQIQSFSMSPEDIPTVTSESDLVRFIADREIAPALVGMLEKAEKVVLIASPWVYGIDSIIKKLTDLKKERNVTVKIIVRRPEPGEDKEHRETVRGLQKRGFIVETDDLLHAKMVLVDNKEVYIGSANLVKKSIEQNLEVGICTCDPGAVAKALDYFEEAFQRAFDRRFEK
jgi:phosphatidylserine/phosphatidylglycerophosphate/cardiolipin synthase-like enzyme